MNETNKPWDMNIFCRVSYFKNSQKLILYFLISKLL